MADPVLDLQSALVSDTFLTYTFGILADFDYLDSHITQHHQDIVGWKGTYLNCSSFAVNPSGSGCAAIGAAAAAGTVIKAPSWFPQDMAMYFENTNSRRKDGRLAVQWHPSDTILVTLDDNYSSDDEHVDRFQRSTWFGAFNAVTQDANGTISNFSFTGPTDLNANVDDSYIVTNTPGINVKWDVNDNWSATLDADQSVSKLNPNGGLTAVDADVGFGNGTNNYTGGLVLNPNNNVLPYWSAYGPNSVASGSSAVSTANYNGLSPFIIGSHVFPLGSTQSTDKIDNVKLEATWKKDDTKINFGMQFVDDLWNTHESDTFQNNEWQTRGRDTAPPRVTRMGVALPAGHRSHADGVTGNGCRALAKAPRNLPSDAWWDYNAYSVLAYLETPARRMRTRKGLASSANYPDVWRGNHSPLKPLSDGSVQHVDQHELLAVHHRRRRRCEPRRHEADHEWRPTGYQKTGRELSPVMASPPTGIVCNGAGRDPTAYTCLHGAFASPGRRSTTPTSTSTASLDSEPAGDAGSEDPSGCFRHGRCAA